MFHAHSTAYQSYPQNHWVSGWVWMVLIPSPEDKIHPKDPQNGNGQVMNRSKVAFGWYRVGERAGIRSGAVISHEMNDNLQLSTRKFAVPKLFYSSMRTPGPDYYNATWFRPKPNQVYTALHMSFASWAWAKLQAHCKDD